MSKLGSEKRPARFRVNSPEKASEIGHLCEEHGWKYIIGIEPDKEEDISDLYKLMGQSTQAKAEPIPGRNEPCPCGSGKKYKKCCGTNK